MRSSSPSGMAAVGSSAREPCREFMVRGTKFEVAEKYGLIKVSTTVWRCAHHVVLLLGRLAILDTRSLVVGCR